MIGGTFVPDIELCPDCQMRPARPRARGRRCEPCATRHRHLHEETEEQRERRLSRERERQRKLSAERKAAGPQFFSPPGS